MNVPTSIQLPFRRGFTLIELLVSMAITIILLGVLVYLTAISMDTYRDSRNEVRASRQAKEALETIAKDLESIITRRDGNEYEWAFAGQDPRGLEGPSGREISNNSQLIFFTGATDRYNGQIGVNGVDNGGDVSAVGYRLVYRDQIGNTDADDYAVFSLYRNLVNPDEAFDLLAVPDLKTAYRSKFGGNSELTAENFLVENIYEFTVTFLIEYVENDKTKIERVTLRQSGQGAYTEFRLKGNEITVSGGGANASKVTSGRLAGAEVSITVISDHGLTLAKKTGLSRNDILKKHCYHYTKTITTPRP